MYRLIREQRKTIAIHIEEDFTITIKAPYQVTEADIKKVYEGHIGWVEKTIHNKRKSQQAVDWISKKEIMYFGEIKVVHLIETTAPKAVKLIDNSFYIFTPSLKDRETIKKQMQDYYKRVGKVYLRDITDKYCSLLNCSYNNLTMKNQKTRWGSCSSKGNLNYNIGVIAAPKEMIEYIVLHEVMHLIHFHHGKTFWEAIEAVMPDYKKRKQYFTDHIDKLRI